jgi:hypothetical protein
MGCWISGWCVRGSQCLVAIIRLRNHPQALWLSELGSYLQGYEGYAASATAGTKRVGKLLRSVKWTVGLIDRYPALESG